MANGDGKFGPTWKWVVAVLITILFTVSGAVYSQMRADIVSLQSGKVDKDQYCRDIDEIKTGIRDIRNWQLNGGAHK